ncbi:MAG: MBL fold metallo-hydrolase [Candidatus Magasanikbacteria bacterium]|nr:MBL fold metallo-hydrolase [Candidatus Magasanikbacteria bacterium]
MKVHFLGAAGEVTGSCYLVEFHEKKILVDCGVFQGSEMADERSHAAFDFDVTQLSAVIITHAHIDHCGRVPLLFARGFRGPVYATEPTGELTKLQWDDMVNLMEEKFLRQHHPVLYAQEDADRAKHALVELPYGRPTDILPGVDFVFHDAGHIFGSSWVEIRSEGKVIVFSGDIGNDHVPIVRETEPLVACDLLVTEATYGDRTHTAPTQRREDLRKVIIDSIKRGGTLMIAAFSIERTQEILFELDQLIEHERVLPRIPFFLDSPLAIRANAVYRKFTEYYDEEAAREWKAGDDFLDFPGLKITLSVAESKMINSAPNPKVIIAGSGMLSGGRIVHHLMRYLPDPNSTLLIISYQAEGTLGRKIMDHTGRVTINGEQIPVKCHIERIDSYSAHGDQDKLLSWMVSGPSAPKHVVVVHSDPPAAASFVALAGTQNHVVIEAARPGQIVEV